jgi:hypothetical protein
MCACGRRCLEQMPGDVCRQAVAVAEAHADSDASDDAMNSICGAASFEVANHRQYSEAYRAANVAEWVASLEGLDLYDLTDLLTDDAASLHPNPTDEYTVQADFLRDIFGNPFRPVTFSAAWRTDTAVSLARTMYESREFSAMPILADALQDAGCDNTDILDHCRDTNQVHVRGCWVVDFVLGRT